MSLPAISPDRVDGQDGPQRGPSNAKRRQTVSAACERCRKHKIKCDNQRPVCGPCGRRGQTCDFVTEKHETRRDARKRKLDEVEHLFQLVSDILASPDEGQVDAIRLHLRDGESLPDAVRHIVGPGMPKLHRTWMTSQSRSRASRGHEDDLASSPVGSYSDMDEDLPLPDPKRSVDATAQEQARLPENFITLLAQSTASLFRILCVGFFVLHSKIDTHRLDTEALLRFRDHIVTSQALDDLVCDATLYSACLASDGSAQRSLNDPGRDPSQSAPRDWAYYRAHSQPLLRISVARWTNLPISDYAASHIISSFLTGPNAYWRFVEDDLFLRDLHQARPGQSRSYCDALLVNAVLAFGSQFSACDEASDPSGDLRRRGERFYHEALRLWQSEQQTSRPSIVTLQALLILAMLSIMLEEHGTASDLISRVLVMNRLLPRINPYERMNQTYIDEGRARSSIASTAVWFHISYTYTMLYSTSQLRASLHDATDLHDWLSDTMESWQYFPYLSESQPYRRNELLHVRTHLTQIQWDALHIKAQGDESTRDFAGFVFAAARLAEGIQQWSDNLPEHLRPIRTMPLPLYEFHAQIRGVQIILLSHLLEAIVRNDNARIPISRTADGNTHYGPYSNAQQVHVQLLHILYQSAVALRDCRMVYGWKVPLAWLSTQATVAAMALLVDLRQEQQNASIQTNQRAPGSAARQKSTQPSSDPRARSTSSHPMDIDSSSTRLPYPRASNARQVSPSALPPIQALQLPSSSRPSASNVAQGQAQDTAIERPSVAFEECFRALLAFSQLLQHAREAMHTLIALAAEFEILLPPHVQQMIDLTGAADAKPTWFDRDAGVTKGSKEFAKLVARLLELGGARRIAVA